MCASGPRVSTGARRYRAHCSRGGCSSATRADTSLASGPSSRGDVTDRERDLTQAIITLEAIGRRFCASEPRCPQCGLLRGPQFSGWLPLDHARIYLTGQLALLERPSDAERVIATAGVMGEVRSTAAPDQIVLCVDRQVWEQCRKRSGL